MDKKTRLINIYLKIHQKRDLSWNDLEYLALYDPECFEKTCKNVVYNIPKTKEIILQEEEKKEKELPAKKVENKKKEYNFSVEQALKNLKREKIKRGRSKECPLFIIQHTGCCKFRNRTLFFQEVLRVFLFQRFRRC